MTNGVEYFIFGYNFIRFARRVDKMLDMTKQLN
jgi:hypothetical protein